MTNNHMTKSADLTRHGKGTGALRTRRPDYVDFMPPCNDACPAGENIQAWLALAQAGDHEAAWRELVVNNPLPSVHGRVACQLPIILPAWVMPLRFGRPGPLQVA